MLLSLLLLNFQCKPGAKNARGKGKEGDAANGTEGRHNLPLPRDRHAVAVSHRAQCDHPPPERVSKAGKVFVVVLLHHVDHEGGEDEDEEADVERGDELLPVGVHHRAQQLPRPAPPAETGGQHE